MKANTNRSIDTKALHQHGNSKQIIQLEYAKELSYQSIVRLEKGQRFNFIK